MSYKTVMKDRAKEKLSYKDLLVRMVKAYDEILVGDEIVANKHALSFEYYHIENSMHEAEKNNGMLDGDSEECKRMMLEFLAGRLIQIYYDDKYHWMNGWLNMVDKELKTYGKKIDEIRRDY